MGYPDNFSQSGFNAAHGTDDMSTPEQDEANSADQLLTTLKDHWVKAFVKGDTELGAVLDEFMENFQVEMEKHL